MAVVVELTRGPLVENLFRGDAAVVDSTGRLLFRVGDEKRVTFWRSAAKPVQALPVISTGAADRFGLTPENLAIFAGSHNAEPVHTAVVLDALQRAGLSPELLQCGPHAPFDRQTAAAMRAAGEEPGRIHSACSGKHAGMLILCAHLGFRMDDYMDPASDVQRLILANVAAACGLPAGQIAIGVDGCGVPVFGMPLANMSLAYARLADPERMPANLRAAARRMRDAMQAHPYLVGGRRRICTELLGLPGRRFVAKSGADGVYAVGILPEAAAASPALWKAGALGGVGITVKAEDGNERISQLMAVEILRQLGLLTEDDLQALGRYRPGPITNWAGRVVGERRTVFELEPVEE